MTTHPPAPPAPLDQPQYGATFRQGASRFVRKYGSFRGRASQSELWWGLLVSTLASLLASVPYLVSAIGYAIATVTTTIDATSSTSGMPDVAGSLLPWLLAMLVSTAVMAVVSLALVVPTYALAARRLHDVGWSGWLALLQWPTNGALVYALGFLPARADGLRYEPQGSMALVPASVAAEIHAMHLAYGMHPPYGPPHPFAQAPAGSTVQVRTPVQPGAAAQPPAAGQPVASAAHPA